jgi:hypothetical protein
LKVGIEGHQGDEFWLDYVAGNQSELMVRLYKAVGNFLEIDVQTARISECACSFDGIRDVLDLTFKIYYNTGTSTPVTITVENSVANYMQV